VAGAFCLCSSIQNARPDGPAAIAGPIGVVDRKSVQPMAARDDDVGYDQLHRFIANVCW
jgi:hypothetical protein